jgi:raffinose/stachyose/melibiose transport system permease protein
MNITSVAKRLPIYLILILVSIWTLGPFLLVLNTSLRQTKQIIKEGPLVLVKSVHLENYSTIWKVGHFTTYFRNSIVVTLIVALVVVIISILAAYAFAYLKFLGKEFLFLLIIFGLMIPMELIIIPLFHNLKAIGLLNTLWAIILPLIALNMPFSVFLLRGFMREIPQSLLESARIDGSTEWKNVTHIIIPLLAPALVAVTIFVVLGAWNNFMLPTILIRDDALRTLPVGLNYFRSKYTMDYGMVATSAMISAMPAIVVYIIFQRKIVSGLTMGALKE